MKRALAIVAAVAVVAGVGAWLWWRDSSGPTSASGGIVKREPEQRIPNSGSASLFTIDAGAGEDEAPERGVERKSGGVVRDHRQHPTEIDPSATPRVPLENAPVDPRLILALREQLRPIVAACSRDHAADVSDGAQLRQRVGVAISGERLRVTELSARATGISGSALADCVAEKAKQIELGADGHEDVRHHMLTFPFRLPAK